MRHYIYTDGGVMLTNPSPIAGTWAFVVVQLDKDGNEAHAVSETQGVLLPGDIDREVVTNNNAELTAIINAVEHYLDNYIKDHMRDRERHVRIVTDSLLAKEWMLGNYSTSTVPRKILDRLDKLHDRLDKMRVDVEYELVAGHPSKRGKNGNPSDLERGYRMKGRHKYRVSKYNVLCDELCTAVPLPDGSDALVSAIATRRAALKEESLAATKDRAIEPAATFVYNITEEQETALNDDDSIEHADLTANRN